MEPETEPTALNTGRLMEAHTGKSPESDTPTILLSGFVMRNDISRLKNRSFFSISKKSFALPAYSPPFSPGAFHGERSVSQFTPEIITKWLQCFSAIETNHWSATGRH